MGNEKMSRNYAFENYEIIGLRIRGINSLYEEMKFSPRIRNGERK